MIDLDAACRDCGARHRDDPSPIMSAILGLCSYCVWGVMRNARR